MTQQQETRNGIIIFDLDNCMFDDRWRMHLIKSGLEFAISSDDSRFDAYHAEMHNDDVNPIGKRYLVDALENQMYIAFITARPIKFMQVTMDQITNVLGLRPGLDFSLYMRPAGDHRHAVDIKTEVAAALMEDCKKHGALIHGAFDDRSDVVAAYQKLGIPAFVLNCEKCDAPLLQQVTPSALDKFQRQIVAATEAATEAAPETPSNEHSDAASKGSAEAPTLAEPIADGPTQPSKAMPTDSQGRAFSPQTVPQYAGLADVLERMGATSRERHAVYGDNAVKIGTVMEALFPNGYVAKTAADHRMISHVDRIVSKLTRFVNSGCKHVDSIHDIAPYAAMAEMEVPFHNLEYKP